MHSVSLQQHLKTYYSSSFKNGLENQSVILASWQNKDKKIKTFLVDSNNHLDS